MYQMYGVDLLLFKFLCSVNRELRTFLGALQLGLARRPTKTFNRAISSCKWTLTNPVTSPSNTNSLRATFLCAPTQRRSLRRKKVVAGKFPSTTRRRASVRHMSAPGPYLLPLTPCLLLPTSHPRPLTSCLLPLTSYLLPLTSYLLPPTSYLLPLTSYLVPRTSYLVPRTSYLLPLTSHLLPRTSYLVLPTGASLESVPSPHIARRAGKK